MRPGPGVIRSKTRCPVPGCKEKLSSVNAYRCKTCRVEVCLKHRFAAKHFCGDRTKLRGGGIGATGEAAPAAGVIANRAAFRESGGSRVRGPAGNVVRDTNRRGTSTVPLAREICHQCGASFPHLAALIAHAETAHQKGKARSRGAAVGEDGAGREVCPRCGLRLSRTSRRWWRTWSASTREARGARESPRRSVGYADARGTSDRCDWKCTLSVDYKTTVVPGSIRCSAYSPASWRAPVAPPPPTPCRPDSCSPRRPSSRPPPTATPVASASSRGWIRCA